MSSLDKTVKLATKPKAANPKSKYLQLIIAATWSDDGAVSDVCRALSPRFREPNAVVVFKALIVLHTMIRNGATDNVLGYLSSSEVLRLKNVSSGTWEGYNAPQNLSAYATYLDARIRAYKDLKHDAIRVQAENNRDMRSSQGFEDDAYQSKSSKSSPKTPARSKTIAGRKLRVMTVEKGLLRETRTVHKMIDTLLECRFYHDNLEDELIVSALSMLVKDLLILFQAGNEGVINVLEHYFEMSFVDATEALDLYRKFCKQTEHVVEYLAIARKLSNLIHVSVPNLRHAPVSLAGALQDYLDDPNFEQNRIEYKLNKDSADKSRKSGKSAKSSGAKDSAPPVPALPTSPSSSSAPPTSASTAPAPSNGSAQKQDVLDFFSAIEEQTPIFNGQPSPNFQVPQFQQSMPTGAPNPFLQRQMMTGQPFMQQPVGFPGMVQQPVLAAPNPFSQLQASQSLQPQPTGHRPFSTFVPQQPTGMFASQSMQNPPATNMLQPQPTGSNPFRQSVLMPMSTGMPGMGGPFGAGIPGNSPFQMSMQGTGMPGQQQQPFGVPTPSSASAAMGTFPGAPRATPFGQVPSATAVKDVPARPASTPLTALPAAQPATKSPPEAQPVVTPVPPVPKPPTMFELMSGLGSTNVGGTNNTPAQTSQPATPQPLAVSNSTSASSTFGFNSSALGAGNADISTSQNTSTTVSGFSDSIFSSLSSQPTGLTGMSTGGPGPAGAAPVTSQATGMAPLKAFKPSSSFGAQLLSSLPTIPGSSPTTPAAANEPTSPPSFSTSSVPGLTSMSPGVGTQPTGFSGLAGGAAGTNPTGSASTSTLGVGLRPQLTGGAANPFRASMFPMGNAPPIPNMPTGMFGAPNAGAGPGAFGGGGMGGFGNMNGMPNFSAAQAQAPMNGQQQQQQNGGSLI
ncbi:ANTH-domain-containing protein [Flagelloscypha sp. PMI_526]|nr:ANTH-domain-containing protein [Flagelloscypha sp. PMI_526]